MVDAAARAGRDDHGSAPPAGSSLSLHCPSRRPSLRRPIHPTLLSERREATISSLLPAHSSRDLSSPTRDADGSRRSISRDPCRSRRPQPRPPPCPLVAPSRPRSTRRRNVKSLSVNSSLASQARLALRGTLQVRPCLTRPALVSLGAERPCLSSRTHAAAATACPFPAQPAVSPRLQLPGRPEPSSKLALVSPISLWPPVTSLPRRSAVAPQDELPAGGARAGTSCDDGGGRRAAGDGRSPAHPADGVGGLCPAKGLDPLVRELAQLVTARV
jgi:hypothetical protein